MDRLHSMQVFCKVIDCRGFAAAARALDLSPSVVTRLVADLEAHLGARLLNRTTRKLVLTEAGELYLQQVRRILADVGEAEGSVRSASAGLVGHLKVLAPPSFVVHELARHLGAFRARCPRLTIEMVTPGVIDTIDERFDVSLITRGDGTLDGQFVARRLAQSRVVLCASPAYLKRQGQPRHPRDLAQHELMVPSFVQDMVLQADDPTAEGLDAASFTVTASQGPLVTAHLDTAQAAAKGGLGIACLPSYAVQDGLAEGSLVRVLTGWHLFVVSLYVAYPSRKLVPAKTRAFVDFLFELFDGGEADPWLARLPSASSDAP